MAATARALLEARSSIVIYFDLKVNRDTLVYERRV